MAKLILLFSHDLTNEQKIDAEKSLKCNEIVSLPSDLRKMWSQIPPEGELDKNILKKFKKFLAKNTNIEDFVLIQGEFGMTCALVSWCFLNKRIPIYATTKRIAKEIIKEDGKIELIKVFKHVKFRRYINEFDN